MSDFKVKMHQIRFRLRLRPRPRWGVYSAPPDPLARFEGPTSKGREGRGGVEEMRGGREGKGREGRGREREREGPPGTCLHPPYEILNITLLALLYCTNSASSRCLYRCHPHALAG